MMWERRSQYGTLAEPPDWLFEALGKTRTASGKAVTPDSAMRVSAVYACVRRLAETEATLPLLTYRRLPGGGKVRAPEHPVFRLLHDTPNPYQTAAEFREMLTGHAVLRGNGYAQVTWSNRGQPTALWPMHPDRVEVLIAPDARPAYRYTRRDGTQETLLADDVLHLRGLSSDGYLGLSPITLAQEAIGVAMAAEEHGARFFSNNAAPGGVLKHPGKLSKDAYERLKSAWNARHEGTENAMKTAILEDGMEWVTVGMTSKDAQFLETRQYQVTDIARIFGVPPWMIGGSAEGSMTYSNTEQQSLAFVTFSLRPWLVRWEQALARVLFTTSEQETYVVEHLVDGLLRGDALARSQALQVQKQGGALTANEWREIENRNPVEGGDTIVPAAAAPPLAADPGRRALRQAALVMLRDGMRRSEERRQRPGGEKGQADYMTRALRPGVLAYAAGLAQLAGHGDLPSESVLSGVLAVGVQRAIEAVQRGTLDIDNTATGLLAAVDGWLTDLGAQRAA